MFAASALVLGIAVFLVVRPALEQQMAVRIEIETTLLREEFRIGGLDRLRATVQARGRGANALDFLLRDAAGKRLAGEMTASAALRPGWATVATPEILEGSEKGNRPEALRTLVSDLGSGLLLAVGEDQARVTEVEEAVTWAFLWTTGLAVLLGIGGGALLSRAFLARVDAIARTAEAIIDGDLARRVPVWGTGDDLDRLAGTLNHMLDRIGTLMDSLRQVSSDVAHDLRTPLSRLYQRLEEARTHAHSAAEYEVAVPAAHRAGGGRLARAGFRDVDLSAVVDSVVDAYRPDAEEAAHRLVARVTPSIVVRGDRELLTQAVANLVENALRHTPAGTLIGVQLAREGDGNCLAVVDDGPGVPPGDIPRLADRFYRGERSRTTPGNGLGLSLVAAWPICTGRRCCCRTPRPACAPRCASRAWSCYRADPDPVRCIAGPRTGPDGVCRDRPAPRVRRSNRRIGKSQSPRQGLPMPTPVTLGDKFRSRSSCMRCILVSAALLTAAMTTASLAQQAAPAPLAVTRQSPLPPLVNPPGDIPDSQAFVAYRSPLGFSVQAPEGWSRRELSNGVSFTDKYGSLTVEVTNAAAMPTVASARQIQAAALDASPMAVTVGKVASANLPGGAAVMLAFASNSAPNPVTGKAIRLENQQYLFWKGGRLATLTLSAPFGSDNADQWQLMARSFAWN